MNLKVTLSVCNNLTAKPLPPASIKFYIEILWLMKDMGYSLPRQATYKRKELEEKASVITIYVENYSWLLKII